MALKIKLSRAGATHNPVYRIVVAEARGRRDGRFVETLGTYSPKSKTEQLRFKVERADYWIANGATPTDTVRSLYKKAKKTAAAQPAETAASEV
jgi:small subunit ribosomal protein S16